MSDPWTVLLGLRVRLGVGVRVLALVLICGRAVHDDNRLAADELCAQALRPQYPGLVVPGAAVEEVGIAVGGERVEFVVSAAPEDPVGPPAAVERVVAPAARVPCASCVSPFAEDACIDRDVSSGTVSASQADRKRSVRTV